MCGSSTIYTLASNPIHFPSFRFPFTHTPIDHRSNGRNSSEKLALSNTTRVSDSPDERGRVTGDRRHTAEIDDDSCSSSSIGNNSDSSAGESSSEDEASGEAEEVESSLKGPLDCLEALEKDLPMRRGISNFYTGKSKSFTSLADAVTAPSVEDFAKPEDPYAKKRKNLLAHRPPLCKTQNYPPGASTSRLERGYISDFSFMGSPSRCRPPLQPPYKKIPNMRPPSPPKQCVPPCRSFSLSDLQCVAAGTPNHK